mgnify:FL=1
MMSASLFFLTEGIRKRIIPNTNDHKWVEEYKEMQKSLYDMYMSKCVLATSEKVPSKECEEIRTLLFPNFKV